MTHVHAAADGERLPWLDDTVPSGRAGHGALLAWGVAATVLVAGASFWMGMNSPSLPGFDESTGTEAPKATVKLPDAQPAMPIVEEPGAMPQVQPAPEAAPLPLARNGDSQAVRDTASRRFVRTRPQIRRATVSDANLKAIVDEQQSGAQPEQQQAEQAAAVKPAGPPKPWTPWESAGASGRMVRIGTYASTAQAKRAWARLVKLYPGMKRLKAVVNDIPSLRNGRTYYRLQFGTTSQAHSEVLCQRMRTIGQSCVVVDLQGARARNQDDGQPVGL
jgi:hypothetical protein